MISLLLTPITPTTRKRPWFLRRTSLLPILLSTPNSNRILLTPLKWLPNLRVSFCAGSAECPKRVFAQISSPLQNIALPFVGVSLKSTFTCSMELRCALISTLQPRCLNLSQNLLIAQVFGNLEAGLFTKLLQNQTLSLKKAFG